MFKCGVGPRMILGHLQTLLCLAACKGEIVTSATTDISDELTLLRHDEPMAKKTTFFNQGTVAVRILEGGVLIKVLAPGETWLHPLPGRLPMHGIVTGETLGSVTVTTERRCTCGHEQLPYGDESTPIGGVNLY